MRKITVTGAARRIMMVVIGATLATSAIGLELASASTKSYQINGHWYSPHGASGYDESGVASYYGPGFHGRKTANGETYDQWGMTAAHRTLPLGSQVLVTNERTGKTIKVRINDRGPFAGHNRIIDLSTHAAQLLGIGGLGQVRVRHASLGEPSKEKSHKRVIASKDQDDEDKPKRVAKKVAKVAAVSDEEQSEKRAKAKAEAKSDASSRKAETKSVSRPKAPARHKEEETVWGGVADASITGGDPASERLVRKLETFAVSEVQAEWRKALAEVRKS